MKPIPVSTKITNLNKVKFHTKKILEGEIRIFIPKNLISKIQKNPNIGARRNQLSKNHEKIPKTPKNNEKEF